MHVHAFTLITIPIVPHMFPQTAYDSVDAYPVVVVFFFFIINLIMKLSCIKTKTLAGILATHTLPVLPPSQTNLYPLGSSLQSQQNRHSAVSMLSEWVCSL